MGFLREVQRHQARKANEQGTTLFYAGHCQRALPFLRLAWKIYNFLRDERGEVEALTVLGNAYLILNDHRQAKQCAERWLDLARHINDHESESMAIELLGGCYTLSGEYDKALVYLQERLASAQHYGSRHVEAIVLGNIGSIYQSQGDFVNARRYLTQALEVTRNSPNHEDEAHALDNLGRFYALSGNYELAAQYLHQSFDLTPKNGNQREVGNILEDLGNLYQLRGEYEKANTYLEQALKIAHELGNAQGEVMALNGLGSVARSRGDYLRAIDYRQQQLTLAKKLHVPLDEVMTLGNLANVYLELGDFVTAEQYQRQQLSLARRIKHKPMEAQALGNLGSTYGQMRQYDQAHIYFQQYLQIMQDINYVSGEIIALHNLGRLAVEQRNYKHAEETFQQSLSLAQELGEQAVVGKIMNSLGVLYDITKNYAQAIYYHQQALEIAQRVMSMADEGASCNNLGHAFLQSDRLSEAEKVLTDAIIIWEKVRTKLDQEDAFKISLFDQQAASYRLLQQVLVKQNRVEQALEISERGRAQAFAELIGRSISPLSSDATTFQLAHIDVEQIRCIAQEKHATLVEFSIIVNNIYDTSTSDFFDGELYIWIVSPSGKIELRRINIKPLLQQMRLSPSVAVPAIMNPQQVLGLRRRDIHVASQKSNVQIYIREDDLRPLYQLLIEPIVGLLPKDPEEHIILVPQNFLFLIPFAALQDSNGHTLLEQHTLSLAPSLQILYQIGQKQQQQKVSFDVEALIVGNPTMPEIVKPGRPAERLRQLPQAELEAHAIADLFHAKPLIGDQATKTAVLARMPTASLLHLATHAGFEDLPGLTVPGAIALAPSEESDGWLTSQDILKLTLRANLVVLSACETGQGRITGDGIVGLARSFMGAGVPGIVVSLWPVQDASTAFLMIEFYRALQRHPDKAQGLRHAMLATKRQYPNLLDWAAFVFIGAAL